MLQQTRAQAVIPYYEQFLRRFPTVEAWPRPPKPTCWPAGAGSATIRARATCGWRRGRSRRRENFRADYDAHPELAGSGDYTAAAVASIAFGLPHAVLDGNVMRVIARLLNEAGEISSARHRGCG